MLETCDFALKGVKRNETLARVTDSLQGYLSSNLVLRKAWYRQNVFWKNEKCMWVIQPEHPKIMLKAFIVFYLKNKTTYCDPSYCQIVTKRIFRLVLGTFSQNMSIIWNVCVLEMFSTRGSHPARVTRPWTRSPRASGVAPVSPPHHYFSSCTYITLLTVKSKTVPRRSDLPTVACCPFSSERIFTYCS